MDLGGEESDEEEDGMDLGGRDKQSGVFFSRERESAERMSGGAEGINIEDFLFEKESSIVDE
jgi:hypothetical protein